MTLSDILSMIEQNWEKIGSAVFKHSAIIMFRILSLKFGARVMSPAIFLESPKKMAGLMKNL